MVSGSQQSRSMNRNCWTNSVPYGYGGRSAETIVLPVRIIMSPTCSSRFLVGRNARSATARTTQASSHARTGSSPPCHRSKAYDIALPPAKGEPDLEVGSETAPWVESAVVCCSRFEGETGGGGLAGRGCDRALGVRWRREAGCERAEGPVQGPSRARQLPGEAEARQALAPPDRRQERRHEGDPGHRGHAARPRSP